MFHRLLGPTSRFGTASLFRWCCSCNFNQLIAAYRGWQDTRNDPSKKITFGDGTPLDGEAVGIAAKIADELTFNIPWQQGDVCLLDNFIVMHARQTFSGTRKVLASLVAILEN